MAIGNSFETMYMVPFVGSTAELPKDDVPDGALCHVQGPEEDEGVWKFEEKRWVKVGRK